MLEMAMFRSNLEIRVQTETRFFVFRFTAVPLAT